MPVIRTKELENLRATQLRVNDALDKFNNSELGVFNRRVAGRMVINILRREVYPSMKQIVSEDAVLLLQELQLEEAMIRKDEESIKQDREKNIVVLTGDIISILLGELKQVFPAFVPDEEVDVIIKSEVGYREPSKEES